MKTVARPTIEQVIRQYQAIRQRNPDPIGDHWECFGVLLGEGVWADPEFAGRPGETEMMTRRST